MSILIDKLIAYGCDVNEAMSRFLNNEGFYERCYGKFLNAPSFQALEAAVKAGDVKASFEAAHDLKGVSANMGITPVYNVAVEIVEPLRAGQMPDNAQEIVDKLLAMQQDLKNFL